MTNTELEQRYKKNMLYIGKLDRGLFDRINAADISHLGIEVTNKGINVSSNGQFLYPHNVNEAIDNQVQTFLNEKTSIFKKPCRHQDGPGAIHHCRIQNKIMLVYFVVRKVIVVMLKNTSCLGEPVIPDLTRNPA